MVATGKPGPIHLTLEPFSPLVRRRPPSHLSRSAVRAAPSAAAGAAEPCANPSAPLRIRCDDEGGAEEGRDQRGGCFLAPPKNCNWNYQRARVPDVVAAFGLPSYIVGGDRRWS
ncbi:hypothetical protein BHM03_00026857 [Ensete ventricosum]|nr:hypothetical protein BHM03_00026857 [Ensete ventricosum]